MEVTASLFHLNLNPEGPVTMMYDVTISVTTPHTMTIRTVSIPAATEEEAGAMASLYMETAICTESPTPVETSIISVVPKPSMPFKH